MLTAISLIATAWVLITYWWLVKTGEQPPFNLANAIGCLPVLAVEIIARTWAPLILTATFGIVGAWGVIKEIRS